MAGIAAADVGWPDAAGLLNYYSLSSRLASSNASYNRKFDKICLMTIPCTLLRCTTDLTIVQLLCISMSGHEEEEEEEAGIPLIFLSMIYISSWDPYA